MRTVYTSGSWDLLHPGHINMIKRSRELGDRLVVGVSTDELIEAYKGMKPIMPFAERMELVAALRGVDQIVEQRELMDIAILKEYAVDVVTIGDDWQGKYLAGLEWMEQQGREVVYLPYTPGVSTTGIKRKILDNTYQIIYAHFKREMESSQRWSEQNR